MPRRGSPDRRAVQQATRAGEELLRARQIHGLSQTVVARRAGVSRRTVARVETGDPRVQLATLRAVASAAGLDIVLQAYPAGGPRLRDSGQLVVAQWLTGEAHPTWRPMLEVPAGDHGRSADLVLYGPGQVLHVEIERSLVDLQAQLRAALAKRENLASRNERPVRLVLAVSDTYRNRQALMPFLELLRTTLPCGSREVLAALRSGQPLRADGVLWIRARAVTTTPVRR